MNLVPRRALIPLAVAAALVGAHARDGAAASATLVNALHCRKGLATQGRNYFTKRLTLLLGCVDKLLTCEVQLEVDGTNPGKCRSTATDACTLALGSSTDSKLSKAASIFHSKASLGCVAFDIGPMLSTGAGGLWFGNDGTCAGSPDVPTLVDCVRDEVALLSDQTLSEAKPRAGLLLDDIGLGADFPHLARPPIDSIVISATAPGSGVLVSPGTINLAAGTALRVSGDSATLPCGGGMGQNGKLTITVGSGATAQTQTLKETYGPTRFATFGPYTTSGSIPYTIDLKDQSCMDTVSGNIVVP
jgi:hypothetical protein